MFNKEEIPPKHPRNALFLENVKIFKKISKTY